MRVLAWNFIGIKVNTKAYIFDIQGLSVHDGPGCRTLVFMQGCTLNCNWCSNPEGINSKPSLLYNVDKCRLDGNCIKDCTYDAIAIVDGKLIIDRDFCVKCDDHPCLDNCYTKALSISAKEMTLDSLLKVIKRDSQFWGQNGGVTLSGGEPLLQIDFVEEFLRQCHDMYIHTAVETCGNLPWDNFKRAIPFLDWIFIDLKHPDSVRHKSMTGAGNEKILSNVVNLSNKFDGRLIVRIPVIPGFNDTDDSLAGYISFFQKNKIKEVNLLPLHHLGREKYKLVDKKYTMSTLETPSVERMKQIQDRFEMEGITCYTGNSTPF